MSGHRFSDDADWETGWWYASPPAPVQRERAAAWRRILEDMETARLTDEEMRREGLDWQVEELGDRDGNPLADPYWQETWE